MAGEDGGDAGEKPRPLRDMEGGSGGDVGEKPPPREVAGDDGDDAVEKSPPLETTGEDGGGAGKKQSPPREMASGSGSAADEKPPPPRVDAGETALNGAVGKSASGKEKEADGAPGSSTGPVRARSKKSKPTWFTPVRLLIIFCVINMLNYVDRGTIASNGVNGTRKTCKPDGTCTDGTGVQGAFNLDNFQDGVLSSAFMVGLLVASPIFASLAKSCNPFRLIGVGLTIWTLATAGCGFSFNYWAITVCRMFVGVGEASFISLAAPFIDDNAPPEKKTAWLAIFYMCIPTGIALGYVYGGLVGNHLSWRAAFWGESILMLPFAILGFTIKPLRLKGFASSLPETCSVSEEVQVPQGEIQQAANGHLPPKQEEIGTKESKFSIMDLARKGLDQILMFLKDLRALLSEKVFIVNVLGYIAYNFVLGAYSYWGPKAGYAIYHMGNSDLMFGGLTIVCGIFGTLAGGFILDRMHSTIPNAFKLLSGATLLGAVFCFTAFCMKSLYGFLALFAIGELLVFATQGPVNYVCLHCVKPSMRPLSMAMSTVAIHIFGDVPSSPLVGVLQDHLNNWRKSVLILTSILFLASGLWCIGIFLPSVDRFNEEEDIDDDEEVEVDSSTKQQKQKPALQDGHNAA